MFSTPKLMLAIALLASAQAMRRAGGQLQSLPRKAPRCITWEMLHQLVNVPRPLSAGPRVLRQRSGGSTPTPAELLRLADCVCLDVDSTVITGEGIDDLAEYMGVGQQIRELTSSAMNGQMSYTESLHRRLDLIQPTEEKLTQLAKECAFTLTQDVDSFVKGMQSRKTHVYLISGGFRKLIQPIAEQLGVPQENLYANEIRFRDDGTYAGFDETLWTSETGGKPKVIKSLRAEHGYKCVVHIGDGGTDLECKDDVDLFINFYGNAYREKVAREAHLSVATFSELMEMSHFHSV